MKKPAVVLFDLGNVLVRIQPEAFLQTLGIDTAENRKLYGPKVIEIVKRYERGGDSTEQYLSRLEGLLNHGEFHFGRELIEKAMLSVIGKPIEGMEDLVQRVAARTKIGLLSNTNPLHYHLCLENLPVLRHIPVHFLSYQLLALKPEPAIYHAVAEAIELPAEEILFIDDIEENVAAAQSTGMQGIRFADPASLERELQILEIL